MGQLLLFVVVALVVAAIVFGVTVMMSGGDPGLTPVEPDGKALPLPSDRPLAEDDVVRTRFDMAFRGYRMAQVDQALQRAAYDIGYKTELIGVLEAEVTALREGRTADADVLRRAREAAVAPPPAASPPAGPAPDVISSHPEPDPAPEASADAPAASPAGSTAASSSGPAASAGSAASADSTVASAGSAPAGSAPAGSAAASPAASPAASSVEAAEAVAEEKAADRR
ncbi:DivIVA domain-containing protein [Actinoplanes sp. NPDC049316]|uniref:DivIVA domain-containing protein n=1 Tax=Actinoplanes sp. NPDC049316 TaxID=3154727 RepID=UPI0034194DF9